MRGVWLGVVLILLAGPAAADIVTMKNGDLHHGTVARRSFALDTPYGRLALPYGRLTRLTTGDDGERLRTRDGGRFSGRLAGRRLTVLRVLEAPLEVHVDDIREITFTDHGLRPTLTPTPDAVTMQNGDRFRARLISSDLMVMGEAGPRLVGRGEIHLLDAEPAPDGSGLAVRIKLNSAGAHVSGRLMGGGPTVRLRHGQELTLPAERLASLAVGVLPDPRAEGPLPSTFRRRVDPAAVLRDRLQDGSPGPVMVMVRGGSFRRGDRQGDGDADERPVREVTLPRPFAIGMFEVTYADYDRFAAATNRTPPDDGGLGRGRRPVVGVAWDDAVAYAAWLSEQTGETYRLPTDAEWEYAARGGTTTRFWWGQEPGTARANCAGCGSLWDGVRAVRVGRFPPNPFGLHDTAGNVFEWVADCWHDDPTAFPADGTALDKPGCGKRIIRGGAWSFPPEEVRPANRWRDFPSRSSDDTGFRLVREIHR